METQEVSKEKLEGLIRKVQAMLARADHPNTPAPEADTARNMAEALMHQYRINEAMFNQAQPAGAEAKPQWATWNVCNGRSEFSMNYHSICNDVLAHFGIRGVYVRAMRPMGDGEYVETVVCETVGYESDLRLAEALYTSCMLAFQKRLEPRCDKQVGDQVNAYVMRSAGMEGWRIAQAIFGKDDKALRPKVRAMFKKEAILRGEDPAILLGKGNSVKAYREGFALGFNTTIRRRMFQMRLARAEAETGAIVMASRQEAINEAFYEKYPQYRPLATFHAAEVVNVDPRQGCEKCKAAKSGFCRDHGWMKPTKGKPAREMNPSAYYRGGKAAKEVDLGNSPQGRKVGSTERMGEL